ncbi:hypothetical protein KQX62_12440 [Rhodopseudomonas palustris]|uniref:Uncharacterized protein n=1 Tax=Rhodopseudomonas palustris TaxID=1076 RepID=A0AAX3DSY9_RHOPL|nr:DUF5677 domain-containing protein [Rhodopseudomonas palustris]UYO37564.1 hypothetical protein KQX62_12440 [Rhodopseudomonas palustris]
MRSEEVYTKGREWAEQVLATARSLLPRMEPVSSYPGWTQQERQTLAFLLTANARSSESAVLLCAFNQLWDAEVLVRTVFEGSLKFVYLLQSRDEFSARHIEYAESLFEIALLKSHRKAQRALAIVSDPDAAEWTAIRELLLPDAEYAELSARYDKARRRNLEMRWGFAGLIEALVNSGDPCFKGLEGLAHGYSMASHVQHADMVGVSIALERDFRPDERRSSIHLAHLGRLLSDVLECLFLRLAVGYRFVGADMSALSEVRKTIDVVKEPFSCAAEQWTKIEYPTQFA